MNSSEVVGRVGSRWRSERRSAGRSQCLRARSTEGQLGSIAACEVSRTDMAHSAARSSLRPSCEGRSQPSSISRWMSAWVGGTPTARSSRRAARSSGRMRPGISRRWTRVGARRATSSRRSADHPSRPPSPSLLGSDSLFSQLQLPAHLSTTTTNRPPNSHSSPAMSNPRVFLDCSINGNDAGRIVVELYKDVTPKTVSSLTRSSQRRRRELPA